jgi:hypothetical protein
MKMKLQGISQMKSSLIVAAVAAVVAGCSGGGATSTSGDSGDPGTNVTPSDLLVSVTTVSASGLKDVGTETATIKVTAVDANRNVLADAPVTIVPDNSAVATVSGTTTDATGIVTGEIGIGEDRTNRTISVVVTSGSITKTVAIPVVGAKLTATLNPAVVVPGATGKIQYHLSDANNAPIGGVTVALSGAFTASGATDDNGDFIYSYTAPATEQVLSVSAKAGGAEVSSSITDASGTIDPAQGVVQSASLDANPTTVPTNVEGSTANQVAIRASFFDALNAPISNVRVRFDLNKDLNNVGGTLSSGANYAYSDGNGVARASYIPGTRASGNGGLTIRACWDNNDFPAGTCPHSMTSDLTVVAEGVNITVNTDNTITLIEDESPKIYQLAYSVLVVDSAGNPKANVPVSYSVSIPQYYKGTWYYDEILGKWRQPGHVCGNEDINGNNRLDNIGGYNEDFNVDNLLEPSGTAAVVPNPIGDELPGVTNEFGRAHFYLQYGANFATWADFALTFSASVAGTAGHYTTTGHLAPLATDFDDTSIALPFQDSPFGTDASQSAKSEWVTDPVSHKKALLCWLDANNHHGIEY